ncbi:hypothetical protein MMC08_007379 [Hypocenomyce scalaris]|nr:hypothetical protein [Hypocenomyce scalaris]
MPSPDDKSNRPLKSDDDENPFITFKRYADEQLSSLVHGVLGLPSALISSSPNDRWKAFDEEARRRSLERDAKLKDRDNERWDAQECPYGPADESTTSRNEQSFHDFVNRFPTPFLGGIFSRLADQDGLPAAFPVLYVALSPYSPLRLEEHERLRGYGMKWRHAFEDLMAVQSGQQMPSESERAKQRPCSSTEWVGAMLERGVFGGWKSMRYGQEQDAARAEDVDVRQPENDADEDAELTELDLYQSFLGKNNPTSSSEDPTSAAISSSRPLSAEGVSRLLPDTPYAALGSADLLGLAAHSAQKATKYDNAGNYEKACEFYGQSVRYLCLAMDREKNNEVAKLISAKMDEYADRADELWINRKESHEADGRKPGIMSAYEELSQPQAFTFTHSNQTKPSIISTLTTTEKRTLPDGTVHTKVVLKKRFADGNEESSETVHTTRGSDPQHLAQTQQAASVRDELAKKSAHEAKDEKSQKGWFWS